MPGRGKCVVLLAAVVVLVSSPLGRAARPSPARVAAFFMQTFCLSQPGKDLLNQLFPTRATSVINNLNDPKNIQKLVMFMNGKGGTLWTGLGKNTQVHALFDQYQKKKIRKEKLFEFLKKLSLYLPAVKTIMSGLIKGMDEAMQSSAVSYGSRQGSCSINAQSLLQQIQDGSRKWNSFENGDKWKRAMDVAKTLQDIDDKLKQWGQVVEIATKPIAALFSGQLWEKALRETQMSFREFDKSGGEATTLQMTLMLALRERVREWQNIKRALIKEQKKLRSGKKACMSASDFNKVAGNFQRQNKGFMKRANEYNKGLYRLKNSEKHVKGWKGTKLLSLVKKFASKKEGYGKIAKKYKKIANL